MDFKLDAIRLAEEFDKPVLGCRELGVRVNQIYEGQKQLKEKQDDAFSGKRGRPLGNMDKVAEVQLLKKALPDSQ